MHYPVIHANDLFWLFGRRYLNLNGVYVVGLCGVHGDYSKTAARVAHLNGSCGLRSGRAWPHRVGGQYGHSQTGARVAGVRLLHLLLGGLLAS